MVVIKINMERSITMLWPKVFLTKAIRIYSAVGAALAVVSPNGKFKQTVRPIGIRAVPEGFFAVHPVVVLGELGAVQTVVFPVRMVTDKSLYIGDDFLPIPHAVQIGNVVNSGTAIIEAVGFCADTSEGFFSFGVEHEQGAVFALFFEQFNIWV